MRKRIKLSIKSIGIMSIILMLLLSGCVTIDTTKTNNLPDRSTILIIPPHDVVQGGRPHRIGIGSGKRLQDAVQKEFSKISYFKILVMEPSDSFNYTTTTNKTGAIAEAKILGADYCLILSLGEFRNAAPMTFRTDFVTLKSGILIDVNTEKKVWSVNKHYMLDKTNLGNHYGLIENIAKAVVQSIIKQ